MSTTVPEQECIEKTIDDEEKSTPIRLHKVSKIYDNRVLTSN